MISYSEKLELDLQASEVNDGTMLLLSGNLVTVQIKELSLKFTSLLKNIVNKNHLYINICNVSKIDSRGITFLIGFYKECFLKNIPVTILANREIFTVLHQIKLDSVISVKEVV
jgi:anti-anti-sigma regulatory factor